MEASSDDDDAAIKEARDTVQDFKNLKLEKSDVTEANGLMVRLLGGEGEDATRSRPHQHDAAQTPGGGPPDIVFRHRLEGDCGEIWSCRRRDAQFDQRGRQLPG